MLCDLGLYMKNRTNLFPPYISYETTHLHFVMKGHEQLLTLLLCHYFLSLSCCDSESNVDAYSLHIMEDDGEIDSDFPPLESREPVSKFGFDQLGLVVNHASLRLALASKMTPVSV